MSGMEGARASGVVAPIEDLGRIADAYAGKSVAFTGATGFMGKVGGCVDGLAIFLGGRRGADMASPDTSLCTQQVMVEKLLRSCPGVRKVYLLTRAKKGASPQERVTQMLDSEVRRWCRIVLPLLLLLCLAPRGLSLTPLWVS